MQHNKESDYSPPSRFSDPDSGRKESPNNWRYQSSENVLLVAKQHEGAQGVPPKDTPLPMKELFVIGCIFMSEVSPSYLQAKGVQYFLLLTGWQMMHCAGFFEQYALSFRGIHGGGLWYYR